MLWTIGQRLGKYDGLVHRLKISWTLVHKQLKIGPVFYPPSVTSAFCFVVRLCTRRSANRTQPNFAKRSKGGKWRRASRMWWRRIVNLNETIEISSLVSRPKKHFELSTASCPMAFSDNTLLIGSFATFSTSLIYVVLGHVGGRFWHFQCAVQRPRTTKFHRTPAK